MNDNNRLIIGALRADHRRLLGLLRNLSVEIGAYTGLSNASAGSDRVLEILDYIKVYPEQWHHPIEDAVYTMLLQKSIPNKQLLASLQEEHESLELRCELLHQRFALLASGERVPRAWLLKHYSDYRNAQLRHIQLEEQQVFPLFDLHLSEDEWQQIGEQSRFLQGSPSPVGVTQWDYQSFGDAG